MPKKHPKKRGRKPISRVNMEKLKRKFEYSGRIKLNIRIAAILLGRSKSALSRYFVAKPEAREQFEELKNVVKQDRVRMIDELENRRADNLWDWLN